MHHRASGGTEGDLRPSHKGTRNRQVGMATRMMKPQRTTPKSKRRPNAMLERLADSRAVGHARQAEGFADCAKALSSSATLATLAQGRKAKTTARVKMVDAEKDSDRRETDMASSPTPATSEARHASTAIVTKADACP
mmetsp:Transcript_52739/g.136562  ORF Transcript_52739/g.136562 Transcript_52739/m.136562 type:complete len:138 (+) Transcript_52739:135-548(+)